MTWLSFWLGFFMAFPVSALVMVAVLWYEWREDAKWSKLAAPLRGTYAVVRIHSLSRN